ncbi:MAG: prepilin-type N-terminal cleavage/methylation domain-containing protein [Zavarzinella sp.]|nr:prepilin-type N-terminal cleavage/methylation domain-containing protein [Zavarzinella sp.]
MRIKRPVRAAFTLVEMMVAMALTLFIMAIIAEVFGSAQRTFSAMRTAGQLQERMRSGAMVLRRDLQSEHFDGPFVAGRGGPRVGDQRLDQAGWVPSRRGYFEIRQFAPSIYEPIQYFVNNGGVPLTDGEGIVSTRADGPTVANPSTGHVLRMTVHLPDLSAPELFAAELPATVTAVTVNGQGPVPLAINNKINSFVTGQPFVYSRWAEVQYFLKANGESTPQTNNGPSLPLYSLRRRVRLLAPAGFTISDMSNPNNPVPAPMTAADADFLMRRYPDVAMARFPGPPGSSLVFVRVLGPDDVANPGSTPAPIGDPFRMPYFAYSQRLDPGGNMLETGDDILITDVLSFEIKAAWFSNPAFNNILPGSSPASRPMVDPITNQAVNSEAPFDDLPQVNPNPLVALNPALAGQRVFDTWVNADDAIDWDKTLPTAGNGLVGFLTQRITQPPLRINVRAVQIKIRVWDAQKEQARQITIIQEI